MQYTKLGRTGVNVSRLCLGTMNFGGRATEPDSYAIMDRAMDLGINFFDTANGYGGKRGEGITEQLLGRYFAQGGGRRERIVLATKVFADMNATGATDPNLARGLSARKIIRGCEASLKRMQTDWIDLYQMHHIDRQCPWDEIWQAMETLVQQGKVLYVGSSNFAAWHIATANQTAARRNFLGLVCEQHKYNLEVRAAELEVLPACRHYGVGVIAWSPLAGGLLAGGVLDQPTEGRRKEKNITDRVARHRARLEPWEALCKSLGEEPSNVALAWLLQNPAITAPIIGPRTMAQFTGCQRSLEIKLDQATLQAIDQIWPGPGGEAPEAYAW